MIWASEVYSVSTVIIPSVVSSSGGFFNHLFDTHHLEVDSSSVRINPSSAMSSMPYAMRMAQSEKRRQSGQSQSSCFPDGAANTFNSANVDNPTMYSSKMMNSIWGMYNKYSVHNFKSKHCDQSQEAGYTGLGGSSTLSQTNASSSGGDGPYNCSGQGSVRSAFAFPAMASDVAVSLANAITRFH